MAALLVGMAVMAVILTAAMPTWSHMVRREKEEELIFRGNQYARAINQYQRKFANASPQSLDVLIEQKMLRKKFRDPMSTTKDGEFQLLYLSSGAGSRGAGPASGTGTGTGVGAGRGAGAATGRGAGAGTGRSVGPGGGEAGTQTGSSYSTTPSGGIVGVTSKNTGASIKIYKDKTKYNEWQFIGMEQSQQGGTGGRGGNVPGGRGFCPDGSAGRSVTRGGSTFTECGGGGNRGGGLGSGGFGGGRGGREGGGRVGGDGGRGGRGRGF